MEKKQKESRRITILWRNDLKTGLLSLFIFIFSLLFLLFSSFLPFFLASERSRLIQADQKCKHKSEGWLRSLFNSRSFEKPPSVDTEEEVPTEVIGNTSSRTPSPSLTLPLTLLTLVIIKRSQFTRQEKLLEIFMEGRRTFRIGSGNRNMGF